ncbi:c-type cytochrome [Chitinimonas lacunae]|uniref:C-type cytochrome n=1 Tax=Chitinimonas lacunae TaxID=1963018 RepID=A0ABV8MWX7_9NEIS
MQGKLLALMAMMVLPLAAQAAGNPQAGARKNSMCVGCHGIPDYKAAYPVVYHVPRIGGQHADYLAAALTAYRSGARKHPTMRAVASQLSDQDILDLAAYYAVQKPTP